MGLLSVLKKVAVTAVPIAVGVATGSVEIGAIAAGATGAAGGAKWAGKKLEAAGGPALHKTGSPIAAGLASVGLGQFLSPEATAQLCDIVQQVWALVCAHPNLAKLLPAIAVVAAHGGISDLFKSAGRK